MIGNLGWPELLVIAFIVLLLFGARRVPEIAQSLGKGIREFKKSVTSPDEDETRDDESAYRRDREQPQIGSGESRPQQMETPSRQEETR